MWTCMYSAVVSCEMWVFLHCTGLRLEKARENSSKPVGVPPNDMSGGGETGKCWGFWVID